jgi:two-component system response regulator FixJ
MTERTILHILDTDSARRARLARLTFTAGYHAEIYGGLDELLHHAPSGGIVLAHDDPGSDTVAQVLGGLADRGSWLPVVALSEAPETTGVVKAGALDYLALPLDVGPLREAIDRVTLEAAGHRQQRARAADARQRISRLSIREREVLDRLAAGCSNKAIARELEISPRTVEIHRMKMMGKLGARHAAEAVRLRIEATGLEEIAA